MAKYCDSIKRTTNLIQMLINYKPRETGSSACYINPVSNFCYTPTLPAVDELFYNIPSGCSIHPYGCKLSTKNGFLYDKNGSIYAAYNVKEGYFTTAEIECTFVHNNDYSHIRADYDIQQLPRENYFGVWFYVLLGGIALVLLILALVLCCKFCCRKKEQRPEAPEYRPPVVTPRRVDCELCKGKGAIMVETRVNCTFCFGRGLLGNKENEQDCFSCKGLGYMVESSRTNCASCSGRGYNFIYD